MARGRVMVFIARLQNELGYVWEVVVGGRRSEAEEAFHDETCDDAFYFGDSAACCVWRERLD